MFDFSSIEIASNMKNFNIDILNQMILNDHANQELKKISLDSPIFYSKMDNNSGNSTQKEDTSLNALYFAKKVPTSNLLNDDFIMNGPLTGVITIEKSGIYRFFVVATISSGNGECIPSIQITNIDNDVAEEIGEFTTTGVQSSTDDHFFTPSLFYTDRWLYAGKTYQFSVTTTLKDVVNSDIGFINAYPQPPTISYFWIQGFMGYGRSMDPGAPWDFSIPDFEIPDFNVPGFDDFMVGDFPPINVDVPNGGDFGDFGDFGLGEFDFNTPFLEYQPGPDYFVEPFSIGFPKTITEGDRVSAYFELAWGKSFEGVQQPEEWGASWHGAAQFAAGGLSIGHILENPLPGYNFWPDEGEYDWADYGQGGYWHFDVALRTMEPIFKSSDIQGNFWMEVDYVAEEGDWMPTVGCGFVFNQFPFVTAIAGNNYYTQIWSGVQITPFFKVLDWKQPGEFPVGYGDIVTRFPLESTHTTDGLSMPYDQMQGANTIRYEWNGFYHYFYLNDVIIAARYKKFSPSPPVSAPNTKLGIYFGLANMQHSGWPDYFRWTDGTGIYLDECRAGTLR